MQRAGKKQAAPAARTYHTIHKNGSVRVTTSLPSDACRAYECGDLRIYDRSKPPLEPGHAFTVSVHGLDGAVLAANVLVFRTAYVQAPYAFATDVPLSQLLQAAYSVKAGKRQELSAHGGAMKSVVPKSTPLPHKRVRASQVASGTNCTVQAADLSVDRGQDRPLQQDSEDSDSDEEEDEEEDEEQEDREDEDEDQDEDEDHQQTREQAHEEARARARARAPDNGATTALKRKR